MSGRAAKAARRAGRDEPTRGTPAAPVRWANYRGDATGLVGQIFGPTTMGEYLVMLEAKFDQATKVTRAGFAYMRKAVSR